MPNADHFIPISMYLPPILIMTASCILLSWSMWWISARFETEENPKIEFKFRYLRIPFGRGSFSPNFRPIFISIVTIVLSHATTLFFLLSFKAVDSNTDIYQMYFILAAFFTMQLIMSWLLIPLFQLLLVGNRGATTSQSFAGWFTTKCFVAAEVGVLSVALAALNPSLALILIVVLAPLCILQKPSASHFTNMFQQAVLILLSPPTLIFVASMINPSMTLELVQKMVLHHQIYHAMLLQCICMFYWPVIVSFQVIIGMEL